MFEEKNIQNEMINSILKANKKIVELSRNNRMYRGMGCTVVISILTESDIHLCHVGDSRAYLCNREEIRLLTIDHSVVMDMVEAGHMTLEEARKSPMKNELTQAVGMNTSFRPEYSHFTWNKGDRLVICSDGLWDMLSDEEIQIIVQQDKPPKTICDLLIETANDAGGKDNITVVVCFNENE
jgi:protein phosphatase